MKINLDADLRKVFMRLATNMDNAVDAELISDNKPSDRTIELFLSPSGSKVFRCGLCRENVYEGQLACCEWALRMVTKYFSGGTSVSALALSNS